ncbi:btb/poz domain containing protein [Trypanosoma brucei equiperdum]|uniref:Btb/poz domain containing protein n=1 Tax=Trypanosoma brucei equiperdum TaxID=630700 RepID=A0A3L6KWQ1_9TRYP|nr:btb/poz domain containing protein [Trypanosoma brucei equiperdum]
MELLETVEVLANNSVRFRYSCPVQILQTIARTDTVHCSPKFGIGDHLWRLHLQQRCAPPSNEPYLSVHLQLCTQQHVVAQFKLTLVCYMDTRLSKSSTFRCTFQKTGSAWGVNHFVPLRQLTGAQSEFLYRDEASNAYFIDIEVLLMVCDTNESQRRRSLSISSNPCPANVDRHRDADSSARRGHAGDRVNGSVHRSPSNNQRFTQAPGNSFIPSPLTIPLRAPLLYPFEHLEGLADMTFEVEGGCFKAHRCIVAARMRPILPAAILPLQPGCSVAISVSSAVFSAFLRYIYTEELPEQGVMSAEALLDLYLLAAACEFYDLCSLCVRFVEPLLTSENILNIALTRFNAADEVLNALYLSALLENYDTLIQDPKFEEIPGHLFRRLSLILRSQETVPPICIPAVKNTLSKQLTWLTESGEYSDINLTVGPQKFVLKAHRFVLASRCILFSQAMGSKLPSSQLSFTSEEFDFSQRAWHKLLAAIYSHHIDSQHDFSAEDVAIVLKMHAVFGMDGQLKKEADEAFNYQNALRMLMYSTKHQVPELHERAIKYVGGNFFTLLQEEPQVWELVGELPQHTVVSLFRTVIENQGFSKCQSIGQTQL